MLDTDIQYLNEIVLTDVGKTGNDCLRYDSIIHRINSKLEEHCTAILIFELNYTI